MFVYKWGPTVRRHAILKLGPSINSTIFIPNSVCVLLKNIKRGFCYHVYVMPQRCDLLAPGVPRGVKIIFFFEHRHVAYQIDGDDR